MSNLRRSLPSTARAPRSRQGTAARLFPVVGFLAALLALAACEDNDNMRTDVVLCESAVSHITECCGHAPSVSCVYAYRDPAPLCISGGCPNSTETVPDLSEDESQHVRSLDCASIAARGWCNPRQASALDVDGGTE